MKGFISKCLSAHNSNTLMITIIVSLNLIGSCVSFALEQPTPQTKFQNFIFSPYAILHMFTPLTHIMECSLQNKSKMNTCTSISM